MKIYSIRTGKTSSAILTASELSALNAIQYYKDAGLEPIVEEFEIKTQGKNFNEYAIAKAYKKPF